MYDLSDFLPVGAEFRRASYDCVDVTTRDAIYTLDVECRTVTVRPHDRMFSVHDLRALLATVTAFEHALDDEAWECAEKFLGYYER